MIVDGDSDEGNDCEQSDMVQVLLNIAYAPRAVVKDFVFGPGVSVTFKEAMGKNVLIEWDKPKKLPSEETISSHSSFAASSASASAASFQSSSSSSSSSDKETSS